MLPDMVLTPKAWYRETEHHQSPFEALLYTAVSLSLPHAPFLMIPSEAFDAFCSLHKLATLDREHTFPLPEPQARSLAHRLKRLALPQALVDQLAKHYSATIGKHEALLMHLDAPTTSPRDSTFVGEVSALAAIRAFWANQIAARGVAKTRSRLSNQPLYVVALPKHTLRGQLCQKDKFLVELEVSNSKAENESVPQVYYLDVTTGVVTESDQAVDNPHPALLPTSSGGVFALARGLYRKSLYKGTCPLAGTKSKVWIQPSMVVDHARVGDNQKVREKPLVLAKGESRSKGIAVGSVILIKHERDWRKVRSHHIAVTNLKLRDTKTISLKMRALIVEPKTMHAAVVAQVRELRFPLVSGVLHATKLFKNGQVVSIDSAKGSIYAGNPFAAHAPQRAPEQVLTLPARVSRPPKLAPQRTLPRIVAISNPRETNTTATELRSHQRVLLSFGAAILTELGIHPHRLWLDKQQTKISDFIESTLVAYQRHCPDTQLMYALSDVSGPFLSCLKFSPTSKHDAQASYFELRGAARLLLDEHDFASIEIKALVKAHAKRIKLELILPFCRTPQELIALKRHLASYGLIRGGYVKLFFRVETPAQLVDLEAYSDAGIDGVVLDMHHLSLTYSGMNVRLADHAPLKQLMQQQLMVFIDQHAVGIPPSLPVYGWYTDYDLAFARELYPKILKAFIA